MWSDSLVWQALHRTDVLEREYKKIEEKVKCVVATDSQRPLNRLIVDLTEEVSQGSIPYWQRDNLRNKLKSLKKKLDDMDRARKQAVMTTVIY